MDEQMDRCIYLMDRQNNKWTKDQARNNWIMMLKIDTPIDKQRDQIGNNEHE